MHIILTEPNHRPVRQCNKCKILGENSHHSNECKDVQETCAKCGKKGHEENRCQAAIARCINCSAEHSAYSRKCEIYRFEKDTAVAKELLKL